jgi:uncharacterized protein (TIGR02996 family)
MVNYEDACLDAIRATPDDDTPRLIYADWLEDNGQGERAEFIRVQVERAKLAWGDPRRQELAKRERRLLATRVAGWFGSLHGSVRQKVFRRGLLEEGDIDAHAFVVHAEELFRLGPVKQLTFRKAAKHIVRLAACPSLLRLEVLILAGHSLRDAGVRALAESPNVGRLSQLFLGFNDIGDEGARALAGSRHLGALSRLRLDNNRIGDAGLLALAGSPHLGGMSHLDVGGNRFDRRRPGARALLARFGDRVSL